MVGLHANTLSQIIMWQMRLLWSPRRHRRCQVASFTLKNDSPPFILLTVRLPNLHFESCVSRWKKSLMVLWNLYEVSSSGWHRERKINYSFGHKIQSRPLHSSLSIIIHITMGPSKNYLFLAKAEHSYNLNTTKQVKQIKNKYCKKTME